MPSTLESCKTYFGTTDLYAIFEIDKKSSVAESKLYQNMSKCYKLT